jgi:NAD+ kinase
MRYIGALYNPFSERSVRISYELTSWLHQRGLHVWRGTSEEGRDNPQVLATMDLLLALGGDGTVLRAARLAIPHRVPLLTVALGSLNFMSELTPESLYEGLETLLAGDGWFEERTLIEAVLIRQGSEAECYTALNEVVLSRGDVSRTLRVQVMIDDIPLTTYRADGVMVATATGSTAYAFSAGGPILDPRSRALVLVPVAAHLPTVPAMVLHEDTVVSLQPHTYYGAVLSVDGHENVPIHEGDMLRIYRCEQVCIFARIRPPRELYARFIQRLRRE